MNEKFPEHNLGDSPTVESIGKLAAQVRLRKLETIQLFIEALGAVQVLEQPAMPKTGLMLVVGSGLAEDLRLMFSVNTTKQ